jgi:hypothetical protein
MKGMMYRRGLTIGIICLFFIIGISPSFFAQSNRKISIINHNFKDNKSLEFIVTEFKADGTTEDTIIEMTYECVNNFVKDIKEIKNQNEKLSLLKNYGFIPESVTLENLRLGMEKKAEINGLNEEMLKKFGNENFFKYNLLCNIEEGNIIFGIRFLLGLSPITRILNYFLWEVFRINRFIPSIDLLNCQIGGLDVVVKDGLLPDFHFRNDGIMVMAGFVGYHVHGIGILIFCPILTFFDWWWGSAAFVGISSL